MMENSRRAATFAMARWLETKRFPAELLPEGRDRAFVQDLVYTTIRRLRPLRRVLGELVRIWPKGELEALLYIGAAQILYMPEVPDFAAVNETVNAAKAGANPGLSRIANGVLRNLVRRRAEFEARLAAAPLEERESYPTELVRRWVARYGAADAARMAAWHNEPAETYLARRDGSFVTLARGERVTEVAGYNEGEFIVQDPATRHAVTLMAPQAGEQILDACAAPGGKTIQLAWRGATVTACEVNPKRRARLVENLARLGLTERVSVIAAPEEVATTFDKVLVDAPCSNTGVLRRRPDARWNWNLAHLAELVRLQAEVLDRLAPYVRAGGTLVYSTCSNEPEENEQQVAAFVKRHPEFTCAETFEAIPFETKTDGAFAARLVKA